MTKSTEDHGKVWHMRAALLGAFGFGDFGRFHSDDADDSPRTTREEIQALKAAAAEFKATAEEIKSKQCGRSLPDLDNSLQMLVDKL